MKMITKKLIFVTYTSIALLLSINAFSQVNYLLDNNCATGQLVVYIVPDVSYPSITDWNPAQFTIEVTSGSTTTLGAITGSNGFSWSAQNSGSSGGSFYQVYNHAGANQQALTTGVPFEVARIALSGSAGQFVTFNIPAYDNAWIVANNGNSIMTANPPGANQIPATYAITTATNVPLFAGVIWDGTSWCGGTGVNGQPGAADAAKNCYIYGTGASLTTWGANVNQLFVDATGQLTIQPGGSLTAASNVTINAPEGLIIAADATGTGSFINTVTTVTYGASGSAKVQAYIKNIENPVDSFHIHLVGPLVKDPSYTAGGTGVYLGAFNLMVSGTYAYRYAEPTNTWINIWQPTDPVPTAAGIALSDISGSSSVLSMTGQLGTPTIATPTISPWNATIGGVGNGLYLFSNPFPSGLSLDEFNIDNQASTRFGGLITFYVWEEENNNYGTWTVDDLFGSTGTLGLGAANGLINPGQGFFGQRAGTGGIGFFADNRVHVNTPFLKDVQSNFLRVQASGNYSKDELVVRFGEGASSGFDPKSDAEKWSSMSETATEISTLATDGSYLTINTLPSLLSGQMLSVPMNFKGGAEETYTITASEIETFELGTEIWLEDLQTAAQWHNLVQNPVYTFTASPDDPQNRFVLHFFGPTGIGDPGAETSAVQIYAWDHDAYIVNRGNEVIEEYVVYDMMGRELQRGTLPVSTVNKVNLGNVSGYYIVKVVTNNRIYSEKVFINR